MSEIKQTAVAVKDAGKGMLGSKKFLATLAGCISVIGVQFLGMDPTAADELSQKIMFLVSTYIIGQGVADFGKEKAKAGTDAAADEPVAILPDEDRA